MTAADAHTVFRQGSQTYYYSSYFFPSHIRDDITTLYAFVRQADDYVDQTPQDDDGFADFKSDYYSEHPSRDIVASYHELEQRCAFNPEWTKAFLDAMEQDLNKATYQTAGELRDYMHGSAEVIGLMITRIIGVDGHDDAAKALGRGMQYLNFLRDIGEDLDLGRQYIPESIVDQHGLSSLEHPVINDHPDRFQSLMEDEVTRGKRWLDHGRNAFHAIPYRCRVPIRTATDMYAWTGDQLVRRPQEAYKDSLKPSTARIMLRGLCNMIV